MIGETIGNFEIVSPLGKGGMAEVWLAKHQTAHNLVAIKLLDVDISEDREQVERFFNQAQAAGRIQHAGVGQIFDVGYAGGRAFLVMEYLAGDTLRRRLRAGALELGRAVELGKQIASVLRATHAAGVIHRDLKPENIILVRDPSVSIGERARLVDFGIAKLGDVSLTSTSGPMMGTPLYMSPEQWRNVAKVEPHSDTYALGCVLFEMLCGRTPFLATAIGEACAQHLTDPPPRLRSLAPDVPEPLEQLVLQMLEKAPAKRPTMLEVEQRLGAFAGGRPTSAPAHGARDVPVGANQATLVTGAALEDTRLVEVTKPAQGARWMIGGGAVVAIAVGVWLVSRGSGSAPTPPDARTVSAVTVPRDAAVDPVSKHSMRHTSNGEGREFLTGKHLPEPISGSPPQIPKSVTIRVCFESETGIVDRVAVSNDAERDDPRLGKVIREAVLGWQYATYPSAQPLVCRALDLRPTVTAAEFDAAHPR